MNTRTNNEEKDMMFCEKPSIDKTERKVSYEEKSYTRKIDKHSKFILIGNNIDGIVQFNFCEFANFEEVKEKLPQTLYDLEAWGEWNLSLYQVPENYKIRRKYGYYKYPNRGKHIYSHTYMDLPIKDVHFKRNSILFIGCKLYIEEDLSKEEVYFEKELMIEAKRLNLR